MSDITANLVIGMPAQLFTLARSFKANANGKIYIGQPDTDPTNPANQIQVYVENEDGSHVPVPQPIIINAGGFPVLGGQIKKFVTVQNYSMEVRDAYGVQQHYFKDVAKYDPDQLRQQLEDPDGAEKYPELQIARWRDEGDVRGWGAKADGITDDSAAFIAAANAVGEGGTLRARAGVYLLTTVNMVPVSIIGDGQGKTILDFDNSTGKNDGIVFSAPSLPNIQLGLSNLTIKTSGGDGRHAVTTASQPSVNALSPKVIFEKISFASINAGNADESFAQAYSWTWMFLLGDSWNMTFRAIDAKGKYLASVDPNQQDLDGFARFIPSAGILSCRVSNITLHNIANCFEIKQRTFISFVQCDMARCYKGVYDAPDRVFDTSNPYNYGEIAAQSVTINAQRACWDLAYRYAAGFTDCRATRTGTGFAGGYGWDGFRLPFARSSTFNGVKVIHPAGFDATSNRVGFTFAGGQNVTCSGISIGGLTTGFLFTSLTRPVEGSSGGPCRGYSLSGIQLNGDIGTLFNIDTVRHLTISQVATNTLSGVTFDNLFLYGSDTGNSFTIKQIQGYDDYTHDALTWYCDSATAGNKRTRIALATGMVISTQTDTGGVGNNWLLMNRNGTTVQSVELRANTTDGYVLLTGNNVQSAGHFKPSSDNVYTNGTGALRWATIYAGTGSINTSDERLKTDIKELEEIERGVALNIKGLIRRYKFTDSVENKGEDSARYHFGVMAQEVAKAFTDAGLDPFKYAMFCYDKWDDQYAPEIAKRTITVTDSETEDSWEEEEEYETGNKFITLKAGDRYGIRYEELLCFIIAAM